MKTTLVIMAAGLGSRYGGNKQTDGVGPNGEILMEYGVYDAVRAGFDKIVFIIKPDMLELMKRLCGRHGLASADAGGPAGGGVLRLSEFLLRAGILPDTGGAHQAPSVPPTRCCVPGNSSTSRSASSMPTTTTAWTPTVPSTRSCSACRSGARLPWWGIC